MGANGKASEMYTRELENIKGWCSTLHDPFAFIYNLCQKSLEHLLNNEVYLTIVNFRSNLTATDPLPP